MTSKKIKPSYPIGTIPPQRIWHGSSSDGPLEFVITAPEATEFGLTVSPQPSGQISLDPGTGAFAYTPAPSDKFDFQVVLSATASGGGISQSVIVSPLRRLMPENDLVSKPGPSPSPESDAYLTVSKTVNAVTLHNTVQRATKSYFVSGKTVVLDPSGDPNNLCTELNQKEDVAEIFIYAEAVVIRGQLSFPGANVTIYATQLEFADPVGGVNPSLISTVPKSLKLRPQNRENGSVGQAGGSITLFIKSLDIPSGAPPQTRFITRGADGQPAGFGDPGVDGPRLPLSPDTLEGNGVKMSGIGGHTYIHIIAGTGEFDMWGTKDLPVGKDARAAGKPGAGGGGGEVRATLLQVASLVDQRGGLAGEKGKDLAGGAAGTPAVAKWHTQDVRLLSMKVLLESHPAAAGAGAIAPGPDHLHGPDGTFVKIPESEISWLHPSALRAVIEHAKDSYLAGDMQFAHRVLSDYADLLDQHMSAAPQEFALDFGKARMEIASLLHRLDSNLDYYGNSGGWVPLLSLEFTLRTFEAEVDSALSVFFLSHWLSTRKDDLNARMAAMEQAVKQLNDDIDQSIVRYEESAEVIGALKAQSEQLALEAEILQKDVASLESTLVAKAKDNLSPPFWKEAAHVLSAACKVIPVYQPALGAIGAGLDVITNFDSSQPLESIEQVADVAKSFTEAKLEESKKQMDEQIAKLNSRTASNTKEYVKNLVSVGKDFANAVNQIKDTAKGTAVPKDELEAEIARVKSQDPLFNDLATRVSEHHVQMEVFGQQLSAALQNIATLSTRITTSLLSQDKLRDAKGDARGLLNHQAFEAVKEMEARAKERLLLYQYYLRKAYEYRFLEPYPGKFGLERLLDQVKLILAADPKTPLLTPENFKALKAIYIDTLREIVVGAVKEIQQSGVELAQPLTFGLSAAEREMLNLNGFIRIDLTARLPANVGDENRRIFNLTVADETTAHIVGPTLDDTAFVSIRYRHDGRSNLRSHGKPYSFDHQSRVEDRPIVWSAVYDPLSTTEKIKQEDFSPSGLSLLHALLNLGKDNLSRDDLIPFIQPAAETILTVERFVSPLDQQIVIDRLRTTVTLNFLRTGGDTVVLDIRSSEGVLPMIEATPDINSRNDGRGNFRRIYHANTSVVLNAQPSYGTRMFNRWLDETGNEISTKPKLSLKLTTSRSVRADYSAPKAHS